MDVPKLKRDIQRYNNAGVPSEKMNFWRRIESVLSSLSSEAVVRSETHPLDALQSKEKLHSEETQSFPSVSSCILDMVEKDRAPLSKHSAY